MTPEVVVAEVRADSHRPESSIWVMVMVVEAMAEVPPSPSVTAMRRVRGAATGVSETLAKVILRARAWAAAGVALALKVTTSGVPPLVPPVQVPITVPP